MRCNYCNKPAIVWFKYQGYISGNGRLNGRSQYPLITVSACQEHEGCANWTSNLKLHPKAKIERIGGVE